MKRKFLDTHKLRHAFPFATACFTVGLTLFACADKDVETNDNNSKALVAFNVSETQDQAQAGAKNYGPISRAAFANQLALQNLAPEDLTMQKLPVQGKAGAGLCLIETTLPGVPSQRKATAQTRADITTMTTMQNFSTTASYGYSDTSLAPWFYDKDTNKDGNLVAPIYWDWIKNHACFYAVYPKPDNSKIKLSPEGYTSTPYVDFEVEPNVKNQKDLMTACSGPVHSTVTNISAMETQATAPRTDLTFRHALTAVRFKVGQNLSYSKHITKVEIVGAKSKGKYTLPTDKNHTGAWDASTLSAPATFTLGGDGTVSVSTSEAVNNVIMGHNQDNYVFYMIPQTLTGVQVKVYFDNAPTPAITADLAGTWRPGTTKTYALSQNTSTWNYVLTVTSPSIAYNQTTSNYIVQSYRQDPATSTQQPVAWKVVNYQESTDGGVTFGAETTAKPAWLTALSKENGTGGTSAESGTATLTTDITDHLVPYNKVLRDATPKGSAGNPYNLSNATGAAGIENTANSYLISAPGYYRIPLVYGNAIKGGTTNSHAYQTSVSGTYVLQHFKDHAGVNINSPYINMQNASDPATQADIVWADQSGLVDGLTVTGSGVNSYVNFHVPDDKIKNGNAVIAVKNASGTVMWSWHLWFDHSDVLNTIACTNYQGMVYNFTKQTLGFAYRKWIGSTYDKPRVARVKVEQTIANGGTKRYAYIDITQNPGSVKEISSTLYQWGRKDAFPGTDTTPDGSFNKNGGNNMSVTNGIQHPEIFYTGGSSWDNGYNQYNLWSMDNTATGYNDNSVVKTIYDPCPAGFHMPASNAFTGATTNGQNTGSWNVNGAWDHGWNFNNKITSPEPPYISLRRVVASTATVCCSSWATTATIGRQSCTTRTAVAPCSSARAS